MKTFWLVLNYSCNNRCVYCYENFIERDGNSMNFSYACEVVDSMDRDGAKSCLLIGGEPTLYHNLRDLIYYIRSNYPEIKVSLITNGRKLSFLDYTRSLLDAGLTRVVISIDGSTSDLHNAITRRKDSFRQTISGIKNCLSLGLKVTTLATISELNKSDISNIALSMKNIGVNDIAYNCAIPSVSMDAVNADFALHPEETAKIIEDNYRFCRNNGINLNVNTTIPICLFDKSILDDMLKDNSIAVGCQMYFGKAVAFDFSGNVLPCTHFSDIPLFGEVESRGGRFLSDKFFKLWQGNVGKNFRNKLWRYPSDRCDGCEYWGGCVGGCPLFWSYYDPQKIIKGRR